MNLIFKKWLIYLSCRNLKNIPEDFKFEKNYIRILKKYAEFVLKVAYNFSKVALLFSCFQLSCVLCFNNLSHVNYVDFVL